MKTARQKYRAGKGFCFFNCLLDGMHTILPALQSFLPTLFVLSRYKNGSRRLCEESRKKGGGRVLSPRPVYEKKMFAVPRLLCLYDSEES